MYEAFFHLQKSPFGMNPDPSCLFMTRSHREAFAALLYAISKHKGFVVLTGDAGTGKTSLLRALIRSADSCKFSVILTPRLNSDEFLEMALLDFGLTEIPESKSQRIFKLQQLLLDLHLQGISPVLVVDEAHTLSPGTLEEIRLLTNFETNAEKLLQVVLAGQNDLAGTLNRDDLRQLKQRIEVRVDLKPLEASDVGAYIQHRWTHAGGGVPTPFPAEAIALIAQASGGIPRLVNSICDNCLLLAYASEQSFIGVGHVRQVLTDFDLGSGSPSRRVGGRLSINELNGASSPPEFRSPKRSPVTPRSFLTVEDDAPVARSSSGMRWAEMMNFGPAPKRERS